MFFGIVRHSLEITQSITGKLIPIVVIPIVVIHIVVIHLLLLMTQLLITSMYIFTCCYYISILLYIRLFMFFLRIISLFHIGNILDLVL